MKIRLLIIVVFFVVGSQAAHARLLGWHGSATFFSAASGNIKVYFSGATYMDCELQRSVAKSSYGPPAYAVVSETPCVPLVIDPDIFLIPEKIKIRWPEPPCLSCPYFREDLIREIYPRYYEKVIRLVDEFRVQEYNEALQKLNSQFDLQGFSKEMYHLEQEISQ